MEVYYSGYGTGYYPMIIPSHGLIDCYGLNASTGTMYKPSSFNENNRYTIPIPYSGPPYPEDLQSWAATGLFQVDVDQTLLNTWNSIPDQDKNITHKNLLTNIIRYSSPGANFNYKINYANYSSIAIITPSNTNTKPFILFVGTGPDTNEFVLGGSRNSDANKSSVDGFYSVYNIHKTQLFSFSASLLRTIFFGYDSLHNTQVITMEVNDVHTKLYYFISSEVVNNIIPLYKHEDNPFNSDPITLGGIYINNLTKEHQLQLLRKYYR
jgi:hypothetical protein